MTNVPTRIVVNGTPHTLTLDPRSLLLDAANGSKGHKCRPVRVKTAKNDRIYGG